MDNEGNFWLRVWGIVAAVFIAFTTIVAIDDMITDLTFTKAGMVRCPLPGGTSTSWMPPDKCFDYSPEGR